MRVFVTGGEGFVGARLLARLRAEGAWFCAPTRAELDVADAAAVAAAVAGARPSAVVHLAALSFVPAAAADPGAAFRANFLGTRAVLEALRCQAPAARGLIVSSAAVYGPAPANAAPFGEAAPLRPEGAYARSKAAADLLAGRYAARGLDVVRARPFNHTGAGRPGHFVESSLARQLAALERAAAASESAGRESAASAAPEPVLRIGNPDSVRDILHVEDVVEAYWRLLQPGAPPGIYNIASGRGVSIRRIIRLLLARTALRPRIETAPEHWRPADSQVGDARRLRAATGWSPRRGLSEALGELLEAWRSAPAAPAAPV